MANKTTQTNNPAPVDVGGIKIGADGIPEGWENEQIGFPPYFNPTMQLDDKGKTIAGTGNWFLAVPIDLDSRDENFQRYVLEAVQPLKCKKGPAEDAEEIEVKAGEFFTCSVYAALPLEDYFGYPIFVRPIRKRKLAANEENPQKRDLWDFELKVSPETKKLLKQRRQQEADMLREKRERYRLEQIEKAATEKAAAAS